MTLKERIRQHPLPLNTEDLSRMIDLGRYYVDKTLFVRDIIDSGSDVFLFTRPRRFGKTLNMSMLQLFFEKPLASKETSHYFKNLKIWQEGEKYTSEQGKRPVISLSLKEMDCPTFETARNKIYSKIAAEYRRHGELKESSKLDKYEKKIYSDISLNSIDCPEWETSLKFLCSMLEKHHGEKPLLLIDEYDVPLQNACLAEKSYFKEMSSFIKKLFSAALKTNSSLYKGILTGVTRVSKESIFSGLNNIKADTIFNKDFSEYFGLTKKEVSDMLDFYGVPDKKEEVAHWYDGYMFGSTEIYNPWSVIAYLDNDCIAQPYWLNTSANELVGQALEVADSVDSNVLESLVNGGTVEAEINTNTVYTEISSDVNIAYSLLAQTGYLKSINNEIDDGALICTLKIPNRELRRIYFDEIIKRFVKDKTAGRKAGELRRAITKGNAEKIEQLVQDYLMSSLSFHDLTEEKDYHNVFLGLVYIATDNYSIRSNRESGEGRYDIAMFPKRNNLPGIIFELKHCSECESVKTEKAKLEPLLTKSAEEALKQIESNEYLTELKEAGANPIFKYGASFCGKKAKVVRKSE